MGAIPYLKTEQGKTQLMVEDKPFVILGGEFHNSSGSDLSYMEKHVWPGLKRLGGNCYLTPVYWECMEPEPDACDFSLVDGVIQQARQAGVGLILLWFGLWKNGRSEYVPAWMKRDNTYFYMRGIDGKQLESVSPFCGEAVARDKKAFCRLMEHLKEVDEAHTVIMVQVENEIGVWNNPRDYSEQAKQLFASSVPEEMQRLFGRSGTWEEAFGFVASEYLMAWGFARAVGEIAAAGKEIYPLPMFMNCVAVGPDLPAGALPSGGPLPRVHRIWRAFAPAIDLYGPDIYAPFFKQVAGDFAAANALMIPELSQGIDMAPKALFALSTYNTLCFSPFGIDGVMNGISAGDLLAQTNSDLGGDYGRAGDELADTYRLLAFLQEEMEKAKDEKRLYAFLDQGADEVFPVGGYTIRVAFGAGMVTPLFGEPYPGHRPEGAPCGGGFIIRRDTDTFLVCGYSARISVEPGYARQGRDIFLLDKREFRLGEGGLEQGRILNGDERNYMILGPTLTIQEVTFYCR